MHNNRIVCALAAVTICIASLAQNNTNSPYTRYGLGEIRDLVEVKQWVELVMEFAIE